MARTRSTSKAKSTYYSVSLKPGFPAGSHIRAGITLLRKETKVVELNQEQLEAIKNDQWLEVTKAKKPREGKNARADQGAKYLASREKANARKAKTGEDKATVGNQTPPSETQTQRSPVEKLALNHSRAELDEQAREAGVESPEGLAGKLEVAKAIIDTKKTSKTRAGSKKR